MAINKMDAAITMLPWIQLYKGERVWAQTREGRTRRTNEVPHNDAGSHFARENIGFRAIPSVQTSPVHTSSAPICHHCLANHTTTASTTTAINKMDAAITMLPWIQLYKGERVWAQTREGRTRRTNEVPHNDAGSHFARENTGVRAIPNVQTSPVQPFRCDLPSLPRKSHYNCVGQSTTSLLTSLHLPSSLLSPSEQSRKP